MLFVAGKLKASTFFERERFRFEEIDCATFSLKRPFSLIKAFKHIFKGFLESRRVLRSFKPDLVVGFGSFYTLPLLFAALFEKVPFMLHEQNAMPGKVNRFFSAWAKLTAITFPQSAKHIKGKTQRAVFPLKNRKGSAQGYDSWSYFGLNPGHLTLLVFGGSQGALQVNTLFLEACKLLVKQLPSFQVLHFTGARTPIFEVKACYDSLGIVNCVKTFEPRMELSLSVADLAITRAGAATIEELIEWEIPALLIPFPKASENHQMKNAEHFVHHVGGGKLVSQSLLEPKNLADAIFSFTPSERAQKKKNIQQYKKKEVLKPLSQLIMEVSNGSAI